jgi:transposase
MEKVIMVACDLHAEKGVVKVAAGRGKAVRWEFKNRQAGRAVLIERLRREAESSEAGEVVFAYEASGCGYQLYDELRAAGITCHVLAPSKLKRSVKERKDKNDDKDADRILELLRAHVLAGNALPTVYVPDAQTRQDQELVRARQDVRSKLTRVKAQIAALLQRQGLERPAELGAGWTDKYVKWLRERAASKAGGAASALGTLLRQMGSLEKELGRLDAAVKALAGEERYKKQVQKVVKKLKGVGVLSAVMFLVEMPNPGRFHNRRQVGAYFGLVPSSHESGQADDRKGHITRQGSARLRRVLCQCAWSRARSDPVERSWAARIVEKNPKKRKIALVGLMRRLGVQIWHTALSA